MKNCYFFEIKLPALQPFNALSSLIGCSILDSLSATQRMFQSYVIRSLTGKMALLLLLCSMYVSGTAQVFLTVDNTKTVKHNGIAKSSSFPLAPNDEIRIVDVGTDGILVFDVLITILAVNVDAVGITTYNPTAQKFYLSPPNPSLDDQVEFSISIVETGLSTPLLLDNFTQEFRDIDSPNSNSDCSEVVGTTHAHTISLGGYLKMGGFEGNGTNANGNPVGFAMYRLKKDISGSVNDWTHEINYYNDPGTDLTFSFASMTTVDYVIGVTGTENQVGGRGFVVSNISFAVATPLPVEWLSFTAGFEGRDRILNWATASEVNADFFQVERSWDGVAFTPIGKVLASGNSISPSAYKFADKTIAPAAHSQVYYRLRQVDLDGGFDYSQTISITLADAESLVLKTYPNPFQNQLTLEWDGRSSESTVKILDAQGKRIYEQIVPKTANPSLHISTDEWPGGVYSIQVSSENQTSSAVLIKHR